MPTEPIKRSNALISLSREHHVDLLLAWKLRNGIHNHVEHQRMADYIKYLDENLISIHFLDEEKLLFDLLPENDEMCSRAKTEHLQIRHLITEVCDNKRKDDGLFKELADLVESHVRFEERNLFPYLETKIPLNKLEEVEKVLSEKHDVFIDIWQDTFWIN
ncbi:MAG: hemerythrin domain-containing protein [Chitinophagaceae bacterium]